jgi:hypothetical protein
LHKIAKSDYVRPSARPPSRMKEADSHWPDLIKFDIGVFSEKRFTKM